MLKQMAATTSLDPSKNADRVADNIHPQGSVFKSTIVLKC